MIAAAKYTKLMEMKDPQVNNAARRHFPLFSIPTLVATYELLYKNRTMLFLETPNLQTVLQSTDARSQGPQ
jgi:hypothetical protein